ncbi:ribonuclease HII [Candidatus Saccharibacteria bacterium]|nr:ribonuclease HII [Candidatus Saccharibacteria bacterium]
MAILGIDEVGRGPLAGPLVVGAVILPEEKPEWVEELKDSKKLTAKKREALNDVILKEAIAVGLGWVFVEELDNVGISEALRLATRRAVKSVQGLHASFSQIVIDGKVNFLALTPLEKYVTTVVKADNLIKEVSAASIVAKMARDHYMYEIGKRYPGYGFEKNVGYGTAAHMNAINELGICQEHRKSFEPIKSMVGFDRNGDGVVNVVKNTTAVGKKGEDAVCRYLESKGHKILERNFKTKFCEIDIVSMHGNRIYFTEVKYRKNADFGGGLAAITADKQKRMKFAAEVFLKCHPEFYNRDSSLSVASVSGDEFSVDDWFMI